MITVTSKLDTRKLEAATKRAQTAGSMAMAQSALDISNRYVPVDTGRLQGSGRIERRPNGLAVVYGGPWRRRPMRWRSTNARASGTGEGAAASSASALIDRPKLLQAAAAGFGRNTCE